MKIECKSYQYEACLYSDSSARQYASSLIIPVALPGASVAWYPIFGLENMYGTVRNIDLGKYHQCRMHMLYITMCMTILGILESSANPPGKRTFKSAPYELCYSR